VLELACVQQELPSEGRVKNYFYGPTAAIQSDVVLGEGAAMLFIPAAEVLNRPFTPGTAEVIERRTHRSADRRYPFADSDPCKFKAYPFMDRDLRKDKRYGRAPRSPLGDVMAGSEAR
jgi:hypothetical protein